MYDLKKRQTKDNAPVPVELAFYGGTFTGLPKEIQEECLGIALNARKEGLVGRLRCSTRPDETSSDQLALLQAFGMDLVELGIQSFQDKPLERSQRGYDGSAAMRGCQAVLDAGLGLGIQLLPGMPGSTPESFIADVQQALTIKPACMRYYPCLVVRGTPLAAMWEHGDYQPWALEQTEEVLGLALYMAWTAQIPVIRLSLAPEAELEEAVLAGPRHPALGSLIQGRALLHLFRNALTEKGNMPPDEIRVPSRCQGYFFGHKGKLRPEWNALGIEPASIQWSTEEHVCLHWKNGFIATQPLP